MTSRLILAPVNTIKKNVSVYKAFITQLGAHLVKADQIDLPTNVNPLWADAKNANIFKASLGIHNTSRHGCGQRWGNCDGNDVQGLNDDGLG